MEAVYPSSRNHDKIQKTKQEEENICCIIRKMFELQSKHDLKKMTVKEIEELLKK
tara:strand:+ start:4604 stop:4768 length:165 start_codon:yes stop_codon:yes gene_type:complete